MPVIINPANIANKEFVAWEKPLASVFYPTRPGGVYNMHLPPLVNPRTTQACYRLVQYLLDTCLLTIKEVASIMFQ